MIIVTDPFCTTYQATGHPERPQRISQTVEKLKQQSEISIRWENPNQVSEDVILRAHSASHLSRIEDETHGFDPDTPAYSKIALHARQSVGGALRALDAAQKGDVAFSLMRPPGHHAERERAMGFCYLNQIAIASLEALEMGFKKIAVYDFDVHHGNGTEDILLNHPNCSFFSIHQFPCYPGTGKESRANCHNYPVQPNTPRKEYRSIFSTAFEDLKKEEPDLIAISAGFDAYRGDPLSDETLEIDDYYWLGTTFHKLKIPFFCVLEGGYSDELPELIFAFLKGIKGL